MATKIKENKRKNSKKPRFDKKKVKQEVLQEVANEELAQTVLVEGAEIEPVIAEQPVKSENIDEVVDASAENTEVEEKPKKQTRSRRPNRNTQKKPRTTKKATKKDEE